MTQKQVEHRALIVSAATYVFIAGAGLWAWLVTDIQALFLDFFFSFIALISSVAAALIAKVSCKRSKRYPDGLWFLEPLYAILKSLLTLALLVTSVAGTGKSAYLYFTKGIGSVMNTGPVLPYALTMVVTCFGLGLYNQAQNKRINGTSTILKAESKTNFVDGIQSLGIGISIVMLQLIDVNSEWGFLHYTGDFFVTFALVLASLKEPVTVLRESFGELSGAVTMEKSIQDTVYASVLRCFGQSRTEVRKIGMLVKIKLFVIIPEAQPTDLLQKRDALMKELSEVYENLEVELCSDYSTSQQSLR